MTLENNLSTLSVSQRISKYFFCYIIILPALFLILPFKVMPFLKGLQLPFKDYQLIRGVADSSWVGFQNFSDFFSSFGSYRILKNTLILNLGYIIFCGLVSLVLVVAISCFSGKKVREFFARLFLIPYFIPTIAFCYMMMQFLSTDHFNIPILVQKEYFRPVFIIGQTLKTCGLPVIIALGAVNAVREHNGGKRFARHVLFPAMKCIGAFMLIRFSTLLTVDFEFIYILCNPFVLEVADTLNAYAFRVFFQQMNIGVSAAIDFLQYAVQLILTIFVYFILKGSFKDILFTSAKNGGTVSSDKNRTNVSGNMAGMIFACLYGLLILVILYQLCIGPFLKPNLSEGGSMLLMNTFPFFNRFASYFFITLLSVIFGAFMTITLAYPLTVYDLPGRRLYKLCLLMILTMGSGGVSEYRFYAELGMINTVMPYFINGLFSIMSVFVLKSIFNAKYHDLREQALAEGMNEPRIFFKIYLPKVIKPVIGLAVLQFAARWNSYTDVMLYVHDQMKISPTLALFVMTAGEHFNTAATMKLALIISLPPILLFIIFGRFLTSEVFVSQTRR